MGSVSVFTKIPNLLKELRSCLPAVQFHEITSGVPNLCIQILDKDDKLKSSEIIVADFNLLAPVLYNLPKTKWVQGTWAGVDKLMPYIQQDNLPAFTITRYSGKHFGRIMAEYVLSHIVNHERDYLNVYKNQIAKCWKQDGKISDYRVISDLNIGILGLGQIGSWIAEILHKFGATIFGFGRKPNLDKNKSFVKAYYTKPTLKDFLQNCDYVINVLPNTPETKGLLNGGVLKNCKDRATVFINVGRGSIISDGDLIQALDKKWLSSAILDVFNEEPLPESSLLWSMPQVKITPHVSAVSIARHIAEQFMDNYKLHMSNEPIPTTLDLSKGY
ncbi:2-hydroxyacid dehydrogenase-related [Holotrichia oblita]|uniref:2-hydroxyacid dehydrogenase-related n=1 Tax=Holotrichia oblita TaxID=644536 RepID=A0ACB9TGL0_HOLOL|nr:2-hydroxyacid dehydrogenase-related [Holotrichia oblita]